MLRNWLKAIAFSVLLSGVAWAQGVQPVKPVGSTLAPLFPNAFASADNIAAQTATAMHGLLFAWDSGGANWDRLLLTSGALHVNVQNTSLTVTQGTGTNLHIVCDSGCGGVSATDNSVFTGGSGAVTPMGALYDATPPAITDGNVGIPRMNVNRVLHALPSDASAVALFGSAFASAENIAAQTTAPVHSLNMAWDNTGSNWDRMRISTVGKLLTQADLVEIGGNNVDRGVGIVGTGTQRTASVIHDGTDTAQVSAAGGLNVECIAGCSGGTQYAEDTTSAAGDLLMMAGVVRNDTRGSLVNLDGERTQLQVNSSGDLRVDGSAVTQPVSGTVTANQGGTWTVQPGNTANTTPWLTRPSDGTNAVNIKAASTAALATDPSLVVALSPNSPLPTGSNIIGGLVSNQSVNLNQLAGNAISAGVGASGTGTQRVAALIHDGTDTAQVTATGGGSLQVECSAGCGGGTQYAEDSIHATGDTLTLAGVVQQTADAALAADGDRTLLQVDATGHLKTTIKNASLVVVGAAADGAAVSGNPVRIAGTDGSSNTQNIQTDTTGNLTIVGTLGHNVNAGASNRIGTLPSIARSGYSTATANRDTATGTVAGSGLIMAAALPEPGFLSYSASAVVAPAASATDIAVMPGSATMTIMVTEVRVSCTQTTAGQVELHLIRRSSADTAGTSVAMTEVGDDANYTGASAAALTYTANPTLGGTVGDVDIVKMGCAATTTAGPNDIYIGNFRQKPIVLRGTAQQLAVNLNGVTVTGGSFAITFKWMEVTGL